MRRFFYSLQVLLLSAAAFAQKDSFIFVWGGDDTQKSNDFLAVINANAQSPDYGKVMASVAVPGAAGKPHHTEAEMPRGGFLLADAFESGQTSLFDLRQPLHPKLVTTYGAMHGFMHPHTYKRLPNGHVLATFQYYGGHEPKSDGGGLVEFTEKGKFIRAGSAMDPSVKDEPIRPYSVVTVKNINRAVSTNTSMHFPKDGQSHTIQIWRLSDLKLLRTIALPAGPRGKEQLLPGEPRLLSDGKTVLIHTFSCGLYALEDIDSDSPKVRHVYSFEGERCAVPLQIGHYWIQTLATAKALAAYDISDLAHIREVSRVKLNDKQYPHWVAADVGNRRILLNSGEYGEHRLYVVNFDPESGALQLDEKFRDAGSDQPGVSMDGKTWPHGFTGDAYGHGAVFSGGNGESVVKSN
jgi:hypothetical protein